MFHKVKSVTPLPDFLLLVEFQDASRKEYDVKPLLQKWDAFHALVYIPGLFEQVRVEAGGYGISWNDDIDLSCDELYHGGAVVERERRAPAAATQAQQSQEQLRKRRG